MKTSKLRHDSYKVEINFGIGTQKEMTRWFTTRFIKNHKMEIPVKKKFKSRRTYRNNRFNSRNVYLSNL